MEVNRIFIIGFTAVGKTTIGRRLAKKLGWRFIDTDAFIEERYHCTVATMVESCGIDKFRKREKVTLIEVAQVEQCVVSTGGGMAIYSDNLKRMKERGLVVFLKASIEVLTERLFMVQESRPLVSGLDNEGIRSYVTSTLPLRMPYYEEADVTIDAEQLTSEEDEERIVNEIINAIHLNKK